jgi:signal recognition particle subunit SRP54
VREKAVGAGVKSVTPGQMVVKIVNDELVEMLGSDAETIDLNARAGADHDGRPAGLGQDDDHRQDRQAPHRAQKRKGADGLARYARPGGAGAARVLGEQAGVDTLPIVAGQTPVQIARARSRPAGSAAMTSSCSTPPAAHISTSR